jgi:hypothetical protein
VPTNNSWQPSPGPNDINFYQYGAIITNTFVRPPVTQSPIPSPNPTVTAMYAANVAITIYATSGHTFALTGQTGLVDFSATESDAWVLGEHKTITTLSDTYYSWVTNASNSSLTNVYVVGSVAQRAAGTVNQSTFSTIYYPGSGPETNGLIDVVPEPAKTGQDVPVGPPNDASLKTIEQDADGQVTTRTVNGDGSYVETVDYPDGTKASATETKTGTAVYSLPLGGAKTNSTVQVFAPVSGNIPIQVSYAAGAFGDPNARQVNWSIPSWYPSPFALYSQTFENKGPTALPGSGLGFPSPNPTSTPVCAYSNTPDLPNIKNKPYSNKLVQTTQRVDTVFGEFETETTNTWNTLGVGLTCAETVDVVNQYYDYTGQSYVIPSYQSTPQQISTYDYQIGLGNATIATSSYRFSRSGVRMRQNGYSATRQGAGMNRTMGRSTMGRAGTMGSGSSSANSPFLLVRTLNQQIRISLERERISRHAMFWRQIKALGRRKFL